jgi:hypothetical protein
VSQIRARPTPEQWKAFWQTLGRLKVTQWKPQYSPQDLGSVAYDGTQWAVTTSNIHHTSQAKGDNAYPKIGRPERTTPEDAAFRELHTAFEMLLANR